MHTISWIWICWCALIGFVKSNDQHFIPIASPLLRSYYRRMRPFHPVNDDDSLSSFLITRAPITVKTIQPTTEKQHTSTSNPIEHTSDAITELPLELTTNVQPLNEEKEENFQEENHIFDSFNFWNVSDKPVMANGHVGFIPYGDTIYMNGLYNGNEGTSHRARIPNYANIQFETCSRSSLSTSMASDLNKLPQCSYALDIFNAIFRARANFNNGHFNVEQIQYAHRYYDRAIVNRIRLQRIINNTNGK